jgi:hypothetical protein
MLSVMNPENIKILADGIKEYFSQYELEDLCRRLEIGIEYSGTSPNLRQLAGDILSDPLSTPNRRFLNTVLSELIKRCRDQVQNANREDNLYHQQMSLQLGQLSQSLEQHLPEKQVAQEITPEPARSPRSSLVEFFGQAQSTVTISDADPAAGTLDCLREVDHPIQLLTTYPPSGFNKGFIRTLKFFRDRDKKIELRLSNSLHDVIVSFNHRCWLFSSPLKDASKAARSVIEIIDSRDAVIDMVRNKWQRAELLIIG